MSCLQFDVSGLSFAARATLATITALTYEYQHDEISITVVKQTLALSDEAWASAYEELYDRSLVFVCGWPVANKVCLNSEENVLCQAIGAGGRPSAKEWTQLRAAVLKEHGHSCAYCGDTEAPLAIDHVVPVSRGGSNHLRNLVPACKRCNSAKGDKTWGEWSSVLARIRK